MTDTIEREGYRFIPGPFQYSAGIAAKPGYAIQRIRFSNPVPLSEGFARIEAYMQAAGLPHSAFCACELRSPAPFTDDGFIAFNREYVGTLERWGIFANDVNPVARSNVCPEYGKPSGPSFYAFSLAVPAPDAPPSFVIAGSAESQEAPGPYSEHTVRFGETTPGAMAEKLRHVVATMERRMSAFGAVWADVTGTQAYSVHDFHETLARDLVAHGAARHGLDWHYCRPPVIGLEYEMDCRAVFEERVIPG